MKAASAKAKGRSLQKLLVQKILEAFPELTENDVRSTSMGVTGTDVQLSEVARKLFPFAVEARKQEKVNIWKAVEDAKRHGEKEGLTSLVVFGRNNVRPQVALDLDEFIKILVKANRSEK